ncbi:MAG: putative TonB-dependent receptor [Gammaproteobacteria bacterium]|nr:putative TonB-dependent receptor [Gammaproteobacteria bacterium]
MIMDTNRIVRQAVRAAMWAGGAFAVGVAAQTAQAQNAPTRVAAADEENTPALSEVVVTGSRIASPNLDSISPITAITAEEIKSTGVTKIEDLLNSLPQVVADQGSGLSMGSTGIATINLRGLGPQRTLVLINGRRLMGGDPNAGAPSTTNLGYGSAADINQVPVALIERVDVLTGGAASTYGADAVAGVVNFVMNDHFEGVRIDANAGIYNHSNHENWIDPLLSARKFPTVTGTNWDGQNKDVALIMGHNFADGAGNFEGYLGYRRNSPITADHRDHAACVVDNNLDLSSGASFAPYVCGGSSNSAPSVIYNQTTGSSLQVDPTGALVPKYQRYNYAATHYLQRIDERYTAGFFGHLKFNDHVEAYTEFMFMDDDTRGNYAPAGMFLGSGFATDATGLRDGNWNLNCGAGGFGNANSNPFLTQNEFTTLCGANSPYGTNPNGATNGDVQLLMARRNVEGGPREDEYTHTTWRGVFGARGELVTDWNYDTSFTFGKTRSTDFHNNDTSSARMQDALLVVLDPVTGQPTCRSHNTGCVPWNIFNPASAYGGVSGAALNYFSVPALVQGQSEEDVFTSFVSGDLTHMGIKLPTADDGLKVVFGTEYRRETIQFRPDEEFISADLSGIGSPVIGYDAQYHVWEGFTELRMPLVANAPFVKKLDFEAGYRYSAYTSGFDTNTFKFGVEWQPVDDVRLRASYNRAVRVPNAAELFKPSFVGLDSGGDLCATGNQKLCDLTNGGNAAPPSPAGQYNGQIGGNTNLKPEIGKTTNVGLVFTPSMVPGFSATVDYTDIKMTNVITSYGPNLIQVNCIASNDPNSSWCKAIQRDPNGTLWASPQAFTVDPLLNIGGLENKSIDLGLAYRINLGSWGRIRTRLDGTYLLNLNINPGGGVAQYDCAGRFGPDCSPVTPKWRHRLSGDWDTPFTGLSAGATWRFFGKANNTLLDPKTPDYVGAAIIAANGPPPDATISTISYVDLRVSYTWDKITVRAGVNNVLDKDPPIIDTINSGGNQIFAESNTFPSVYDTAGRYLFLNATIDF